MKPPAFTTDERRRTRRKSASELGDSGGPVFWTDPNGNPVLVSITAFGATVVGIGFYYRIDTVQSLQFIQEVIDSLDP